MLREPQRTIHQPRQPEDSSAQRNTVEETPAPQLRQGSGLSAPLLREQPGSAFGHKTL